MSHTDYAIVVGIAAYPKFADLKGPENDAHAFCDWLRSPTGGNIRDEARLKLILSSQFSSSAADPFGAKPALQQINEAFDRLVDQVEEGERLGRRLYIFLAGHGFGPDVEEAALLMANASRRRMHHIPGRRYANWFRTAACFEEIVLLMDCCRDDYPRVPPYVPPWTEVRSPAGADVRHFYGFATKWSRKARERAIAEGQPVRGLFTLALLEALEKAPPDAEGRITGGAAADYVFSRLPNLVGPDSEYQEPRFEYDPQRDIILAQVSTADTPVRIIWPPDRAGQPLEILGPDLSPVAQTVAGESPWQVQLPVGMYVLRVQGQSQSQIFEVFGQEAIDVHLTQ